MISDIIRKLPNGYALIVYDSRCAKKKRDFTWYPEYEFSQAKFPFYKVKCHWDDSPDQLVWVYIIPGREENFASLHREIGSMMNNFPYSEFRIFVRLYDGETFLKEFSTIEFGQIGKSSNLEVLDLFFTHHNRTLVLDKIEEPINIMGVFAFHKKGQLYKQPVSWRHI